MRIYAVLMATGIAAGSIVSAPADAQHMNMPGMTMPMPTPAKPAPKKKAPGKKPAAKKPPAKKVEPAKKPSKPKPAQPLVGAHGALDHQTEPQPTMPHAQMPMSMPMGEDAATMAPGPMPGMAPGEHHMAMTGALGRYTVERESSGTAWQPDASAHQGLMAMAGDWTLMAHGVANLVFDHQSGPRGDDKTFVSGMLMGMARHPFGNGTVQLKAMVSPDPLMGADGYPLLLASGETANGADRLIDRQHPHDFFMELSASVSQDVGRTGSIFVYAGLPGEPAFGPPAFMHREAILDSPEAPITHHWLDSTHITFGVVTAGVILGNVKVEASRFNAREPNQHRWDIETGPLESTSARVSWNPTRTLALQGSWGHFVDPEQLEPGVNQERWSASALWANEIAPGWKLASTVAWGRKSAEGHNDDAFAAEASVKHAGWTMFGRGEIIENRELVDVPDAPAYRVGKVSLGAIRDFRIADHFSVGAGGLFSVNFVPDALAPIYGSSNPTGAMGFIRLRLD